MKQVRQDEFFAVVNPMDVRLRCEPDATYWETPARRVIGKSAPGYLRRDADGRYTSRKEWFLAT